MAAQLAKGANTPLRGSDGDTPARVRIEVRWKADAAVDVSLVAVACDGSGKALSPAHLVTFDGATMHGQRQRFTVLMELDAAPHDVTNVAFALVSGNSALGELTGLTMALQEPAGGLLASYDVEGLSDEHWLLVGEVYRRVGQWKVRAVGQGGRDGRPGLLRSFGIES